MRMRCGHCSSLQQHVVCDVNQVLYGIYFLCFVAVVSAVGCGHFCLAASLGLCVQCERGCAAACVEQKHLVSALCRVRLHCFRVSRFALVSFPPIACEIRCGLSFTSRVLQLRALQRYNLRVNYRLYVKVKTTHSSRLFLVSFTTGPALHSAHSIRLTLELPLPLALPIAYR